MMMPSLWPPDVESAKHISYSDDLDEKQQRNHTNEKVVSGYSSNKIGML